VGGGRGDQIGRIFANVLGDCFTTYFGQVFLLQKNSKFCCFFPTENCCVLILTKNRVGYILGNIKKLIWSPWWWVCMSASRGPLGELFFFDFFFNQQSEEFSFSTYKTNGLPRFE
jgi:hypothetical protein